MVAITAVDMIKTEKQFVPLAVELMLLTDKQLAVVLNVSVAHVHSLDNQGKIPAAVSLGKSRRWSTDEIRAWVCAGCPKRIEWQQRGDK